MHTLHLRTAACTYISTSCYYTCSTQPQRQVRLSFCHSATYKSSCCSHHAVVFVCILLLLSSPMAPVPLVATGQGQSVDTSASWPCDKRDLHFDLSCGSMLLRAGLEWYPALQPLTHSLTRYIHSMSISAIQGERKAGPWRVADPHLTGEVQQVFGWPVRGETIRQGGVTYMSGGQGAPGPASPSLHPSPQFSGFTTLPKFLKVVLAAIKPHSNGLWHARTIPASWYIFVWQHLVYMECNIDKVTFQHPVLLNF